MSKAVFAVIGAGWRTEFFLRIAKALPDRFEISGILVRNEERGREFEEKWGVKTYTDLDSMIEKANPTFVVVSVPWKIAPEMTQKLVERGIPVLSETPPAPDLQGLIELYKLVEKGGKIQVAEQYQFQPLHAARLAMVHTGKLGRISQVQISVCHWYHGMSLMRKLLGVTYENAIISAKRFVSPIIDSPDRWGSIQQESRVVSEQVIAYLDFGDKLGLYDFANEQYFSWIRSLRLHVRGEKGEMTDERIKYLKDFKTPIVLDLKRQNAGENGNLEGYYLKGILAGEDWVYQNPFIPGRITDDEIAIASCLEKMDQYAKGGPGFYSLAEASQDHYLALMIDQAAKTGETIKTETQPWAGAV